MFRAVCGGSLVEAKIASPRSILALRGSLPFMRLRHLFPEMAAHRERKSRRAPIPISHIPGITPRGSLLVCTRPRRPWPRKDKRGVDLISEVLPFGRLLYGEPNATSNAIGYTKAS